MIEDSTVARVALSAIDIDKDTLSFVALYDTLAFDMQIDGDTLEIISLPNYFGSSSMSVVVSDGVSSDTTAFKIDVAPRQDPPSTFNWIGSLTDTIRVDIQISLLNRLYYAGAKVMIRWMVSMLLMSVILYRCRREHKMIYNTTRPTLFNSDCSIAL